MYHLTGLTIRNVTKTEMEAILNRILLNPRRRSLAIYGLTYHFDEDYTGPCTYEETFDEDRYECIEPSKMQLPVGSRADVYYKELGE